MDNKENRIKQKNEQEKKNISKNNNKLAQI